MNGAGSMTNVELSKGLGSVRSLTDFLNDLLGVMTRKARPGAQPTDRPV